MKNKKIVYSILSAMVIILGVIFGFQATGEINKNEVHKAVDIVIDSIVTYNMTDQEIKDLPTTKIEEQTEEQEQETGEEQQVTETEGFLLQGDIAYNGDSEFPSISLGNYTGLTYYSQIDSRWKNHPYTSVGNPEQTIGSSGCGPTSASMVVTAIKGAITPDDMGDLFVDNGFRSADNGTYFSAFRWTADVFDIEYLETYKLDDVVDLLRNNYLVVASCGNGLFTTGGHFIVLVGIDGDTIKIYDPYLYAGKFDTPTRRGKVWVDGYNVYCTIDNFREYANYTKFFAYKNTGAVKPNDDKPVVVEPYTRYVQVNTALNVRTEPWGDIVGSLSNGTQVTVYETIDNWAMIGDCEWVCSDYLVQSTNTYTEDTVGEIRKIQACYLYSNPDLTGTIYTYKSNTTITILENVSPNVDYIRVNATGRYAYIDTSNYIGTSQPIYTGTVGETRKTNACYLYSNPDLTGTIYTYKSNTTVTILENINSSVDLVRVNVTGRVAYIDVNSYR